MADITKRSDSEILADDIKNQNLHTIYAKPEIITASHLKLAREKHNQTLHRAPVEELERASRILEKLIKNARLAVLQEAATNPEYQKVAGLAGDIHTELQRREKLEAKKEGFISRFASKLPPIYSGCYGCYGR